MVALLDPIFLFSFVSVSNSSFVIEGVEVYRTQFPRRWSSSGRDKKRIAPF